MLTRRFYVVRAYGTQTLRTDWLLFGFILLYRREVKT
jgi:hypothetical protein